MCECDLLKDWTRALRILPGGESFVDGILINETDTGFTIRASNENTEFDRDHHASVSKALSEAGFEAVELIDTSDEWSVSFTPDGESGEWELDLGSTSDGLLSFRVDVGVDASPYGIESLDELWDLYADDLDAALEVQEQRLQEAISTLEPLRQAIDSLAVDS